jgi:putative DNA primase/helicase
MDTEFDLRNLAASDGKSTDPLPGEPRTEYGYARRLIALYGDRLRYVPPWGRWLIWDGTRWTSDVTGQAQRWQKVIARRLTNDALAIPDAGERRAALHITRRGESSAGVAGALKLASTEAGLAVSPGDLDADPFLLNCRNGIVDLRTGDLSPHDPDRLLTKVAGADYVWDAKGSEFDRFLARIQPDAGMRQYLARLLGHSLEGRVVEHVLPIWYGSGANGKSTLIAAVLAALGDYADAADPLLLTARTFDAHPTGVADLFGLRLAVLHESDNGRRLAEATVKRLTGGDVLKARRMREDFWSFAPSHTFIMLTNHKPIIAGTDDAIWRRPRLIPFDVVIPQAEQDETIGERLALEAAAVLAWLIDGYHEWRARGLDEPDAVRDATAAYRLESDAVNRFIEERCFTGPYHTVRSAELFNAWVAWCKVEGEESGTNKAFSTMLEAKGYDKRPTNVGAVWLKLGLAAEDDGFGER